MATALVILGTQALRVLHKILGNFLYFAKLKQHFWASLEWRFFVSFTVVLQNSLFHTYLSCDIVTYPHATIYFFKCAVPGRNWEANALIITLFLNTGSWKKKKIYLRKERHNVFAIALGLSCLWKCYLRTMTMKICLWKTLSDAQYLTSSWYTSESMFSYQEMEKEYWLLK